MSHCLEKLLAPPTHASSTSMDYLRERYQAADKSRRYCSDSNTKNAPGRVRHDGNARVCMQCAAKANSMESARLSDGMRRKCSQIEYFSVQVVRCSGASVEEGVHMHQADYHVKKVWKNVQSSEDCWSLAPRCRAHITCNPFSEPK